MSPIKNLLLVVLIFASLCACSGDSKSGGSGDSVRQYLLAFNAQDSTAMGAMVTDDVKWLSVSDSSVSIEVEGRTALVNAMDEYFESCPSCRSEIQGLVATGNRVSVVEVARWDADDEAKSQRALAVYEFSGQLIQNVYYFSEEP